VTASLFAGLLALSLQTGPALDAIVIGVHGHRHDIFSEAHGRTLAVIFVNHDCPVCNSYAPEFEKIIANYHDRVQFDLVYAEQRFTGAMAQKHAETYGLTGARLFVDPTGSLASECGATVVPEAAVFDGSGKRAYLGRIDDLYYDYGKQRSRVNRHDLRDALDATLSHRPAKAASGPPFGCVIETSSKP